MIDVKLENLAEVRRAFDPRVVGEAVKRAVSTAAERVRTHVSRDVRERYTIKAGDIGRSVTLRAVHRGSIIDRLLVYTGGRLSLAKFAARPRQVRVPRKDGKGTRKLTGVTVQVKRAGGRQLVQGGFLARGRNAKDDTPQQIFQRAGDSRLPIRKLTGPAIPTMVANPAVIQGASTLAMDVLAREFPRQMDVLMANTRGGGAL